MLFFKRTTYWASSTNHGLESLNAQIKKTGTLREQLSISAFFERALKIVKEWSIDRNPNQFIDYENKFILFENTFLIKKILCI